MAATSTSPHSVRPAPKTKSRRLIGHVLDQLQLCALSETRDNGRELQAALKQCIEYLNKCVNACQDAARPPPEIAKLRQDVIEADQEIVSFLVQAVAAVYAQCDQMLESRNVHGLNPTAASSVRLDGAMLDKVKLGSLQSWLIAQLSGRVATANVHPKTKSRPNSRDRHSRHSSRPRPYSGTHARDGRKDARNGREQDSVQRFVDISGSVLRASGRHPMEAPLNNHLSDVLQPSRVQKLRGLRKKSKLSEAKRQNILVEDMVDWWKAKDGWEKEKREEKQEK